MANATQVLAHKVNQIKMKNLFQSIIDLGHMHMEVYKKLVGFCVSPRCEIQMMWKKH